MQKIALVVDSLADLPPDVIAEHNIHTIPIRIRFGTDEYTDRVDLDT
ncbi:MAG: DegV family protein, partial [Candidatus Marinimicrobia bacterium]|nr:DegV family protein [Candidatus Neomarinimicrobiota bacterium]